MDKGKRELTPTTESYRLQQMIAHRDFLLQQVEDQNKRIRSMRLKEALRTMAGDPAIEEFLSKQTLQDNTGDAT